MENYTVYMHIFPNGKRYIGITSDDVAVRWKNGFGYKTQYVFTAIVKYGWDNIEHHVLHTNLSKEDAVETEKNLIKKYRTLVNENGYNVDLGGTEESRSEETKKKISESKQGRKVSEKTKSLLRIAMTDEKKKKMQEASAKKCSKPVRCIDTGIEYKSVSEAGRAICIDPSSISACCKKKKRYKTAGGFHWEYI